MKLEGAVAIVTGGAGSIGTSVVKMLSERGASPIRWDRARADDVIPCDVGDAVSVRAAMDETIAKHGTPRVLVNTAGVSGGPSLWPDEAEADWDHVFSSTESWQATLAVNVVGIANTMREFARVLSAATSTGAIVNITSMGGSEWHDPAVAAYSTSKAAANALTRIAARGLAPLGIRVNAVAPGVMEDRIRETGVGWTKSAVMTGHLDRIIGSTPLEPRLTRSEDVAGSVIALLSVDFVTGQIVVCDGGISIRSMSREI